MYGESSYMTALRLFSYSNYPNEVLSAREALEARLKAAMTEANAELAQLKGCMDIVELDAALAKYAFPR